MTSLRALLGVAIGLLLAALLVRQLTEQREPEVVESSSRPAAGAQEPWSAPENVAPATDGRTSEGAGGSGVEQSLAPGLRVEESSIELDHGHRARGELARAVGSGVDGARRAATAALRRCHKGC